MMTPHFKKKKWWLVHVKVGFAGSLNRSITRKFTDFPLHHQRRYHDDHLIVIIRWSTMTIWLWLSDDQRWSSNCDNQIIRWLNSSQGSYSRLDNWPLFWVESYVLICLWICQEIIPSNCSCFENCTPVDNWLCLFDGGKYFYISYFVLFITSSLQ